MERKDTTELPGLIYLQLHPGEAAKRAIARWKSEHTSEECAAVGAFLAHEGEPPPGSFMDALRRTQQRRATLAAQEAR